MAGWDATLQDMKIAGKVLPTASRTLSGGRDFQRSSPVYRPGQTTADTGRRAFRFRLSVPLYDQAAGVVFPDDYEELLFILTDDATGGAVEYVDPVLGAFDVQIESFDVVDDAKNRDGGVFTILLEENDDSESALRFTLQPEDSGTRAAASSVAMRVDEDLEEAGIDDEALDSAFASAGVPRSGAEAAWPVGEFFTSQTSTLFDAVDRITVSADEAAAQVDRLTARINAVLALEHLAKTEAWPITVSLLRLSAAGQRAYEKGARQGPQIVEFVTDGIIDVYSLSAQLYKSSARAGDILAINSIATPLAIPARTTLLVPAA